MQMSTKPLQRYVGTCGVLLLPVTIAAIALVASTGLAEQDLEAGAVETVLTIFAANPGTVTASMWLFNLSNAVLALFGVGLAALLAERQPAVRIASPLVALAAVMLLLETTMTIGLVHGIAPAYANAGAERTVLGSITLALLAFRNATAQLAFLLVAVAALVFGSAIVRAPGWPRWMGVLVLAIGAMGLVGGFYPFVPALSYVRALAHVLFTLWALLVGVRLLGAWAPDSAGVVVPQARAHASA